MRKRTREIIALFMLVALGMAVAGAMAWYILVGHNWNQAATHIDDMVGSMDGYTVIVYEGVVKKPKGDSGTRVAGAAKAQPSQAAGARGAAAAVPVGADAVVESYLDKGAAVVRLDSDDMGAYEDPVIAGKGGKRYGIFSFAGKYRYRFPVLRSSIRYLKQHDVGFVVALAKDKALLKGRLVGIDLLVFLRDAGIRESGEYRGQTLCVDSPFKGEVQAIIVSPSGVVTSRTIKEL